MCASLCRLSCIFSFVTFATFRLCRLKPGGLYVRYISFMCNKMCCINLYFSKYCHSLSFLGTVLVYQPGLLYGGTVEHDCNPQRSIGYYLEALLMLGPFMKSPLKATLRGVTNDLTDPTVSS